MHFRTATAADNDTLWHMLFYAAHAYEDEGVEGPADIRTNPDLQRYAAGYGIHGDLGLIADIADAPAGAVWTRLFPASARTDPTYVDDATPELAIAVLPGHQGKGVGAALMERFIAIAPAHYPALVLTVRQHNRAVRLYERFGFERIGDITNRVGTASYKMLLDLTQR